jgi:hypothetical protein
MDRIATPFLWRRNSPIPEPFSILCSPENPKKWQPGKSGEAFSFLIAPFGSELFFGIFLLKKLSVDRITLLC